MGTKEVPEKKLIIEIKMANVLIFGGGLQAISVCRSLKEKRHKVIMAAKHDKIAARSNFIDEYVDIENDTDPEKVVEELLPIIESKSIDVVFPMEDAQASSLSQCKQTIEATGVKCAVMDWEVFSLVSDKTKFLDFCKKNDLPHPLTEPFGTTDESVQKAALLVGFPSLIKPSHSEGAKGITLVNNLNELKEKGPAVITEFGECALQEYIASKDYYYNVMLYRGQDGNWGNHCIIKILRYYPIGGGSSSFCVTVDDEKMVAICKKTLELLDWKGFADFDILEKEDGDYRIIEINPRVPASLRAAAVSGINFPAMIVSDLLKGVYGTYLYKTGKYLKYLGLDIAWFLASPKRWSCKPSWFKFFGKDLYYQEGGIKDIPAMWTSMIEGIKKQMNPSFRRQKSGMNNK